MTYTDTIVALATPSGAGAVAIIRMSGKDAITIASEVFQSVSGKDISKQKTHTIHLGTIVDGTKIYDQVLVSIFKNPNSYTGEDVLELQGHGGPAVLQQLLNHCLAVGAPFEMHIASPGEFTLRAFLNDKIDLAQAEAIADLIDASSEAAARAAVVSLTGSFSHRINTLSAAIVHLRMLVEATLDFPEEEIEFLEKYQAHVKLEVLQNTLSEILSASRQGVVLREGLMLF